MGEGGGWNKIRTGGENSSFFLFQTTTAPSWPLWRASRRNKILWYLILSDGNNPRQVYSFGGFFFAVVLKVELLDVLPEAQPASGVAGVILGDRFNNHFVLIPFPEEGRKRNATWFVIYILKDGKKILDAKAVDWNFSLNLFVTKFD